MSVLALGVAPALWTLDAEARAAAGWSRPLRLAGPLRADLQPPQVVSLGPRSVIVGSGTENIDAPASAHAAVILRGQRGGFHPLRLIREAQQILAIAAEPRAGGFTLLAGSASPGLVCCSTVTAIDSAGRSQPILSGLGGATQARLVTIGGQLLAALATERGVWVAHSTAGHGGLGSAQQLSGSEQFPQSLALTPLSGGGSLVAWTARTGGPTVPGPRTIYLAQGSGGKPPAVGRAAVSVSPGHQIDELGLAGAPGEPTVVWVESWFARGGAFHSEVRAAALSSRFRPVRLSDSGALAEGLSVSAGGQGVELAAFSQCARRSGRCAATGVKRLGRRSFGAPQRLGALDAGQALSGAVTGDGRAVVGWISAGHVLAAAAPAQGRGFEPALRISSTNLASVLALAPGPGAGAVAVWNQATVSQQVFGSFLR